MKSFNCAHCSHVCRSDPETVKYPKGCPTAEEAALLDQVAALYQEDPEMHRLAAAAARTEADGYPYRTRVEEIMGFARRIQASRLGVAHCVGLAKEAGLLQDILQVNGFEVHTLCCKLGSLPKERIGLREEEKIHPGQYEALCNPIGQAKLFNQIGTHLNIVVGLCVGHDSLFFRHSEAPVTVLIAKDRVTGHNPAAPLYTSHSYYTRLKPS